MALHGYGVCNESLTSHPQTNPAPAAPAVLAPKGGTLNLARHRSIATQPEAEGLFVSSRVWRSRSDRQARLECAPPPNEAEGLVVAHAEIFDLESKDADWHPGLSPLARPPDPATDAKAFGLPGSPLRAPRASALRLSPRAHPEARHESMDHTTGGARP